MSFNDLEGKILKNVEVCDNERIIFTTSDNVNYNSYHMQDCCESVIIERIEGNLDDIVGSPILLAEEYCDSENNRPEFADSFTWTYQRIKTDNGEVTFVWLGTSNGYYGESVYFGITH